MPTRISFWASIALAIALCSPAVAFARFGKSSGGGGGGRGSGSRATVSAHGGGSYTRGASSSRWGGPSRPWSGPTIVSRPVFLGPSYYGYFVAPPPVVAYDPQADEVPPTAADPDATTLAISTMIDGDATFAGDTSMLGARALFEGERLGVSLGYTGVISPTTDGSAGVDVFHLAQAHLTYALVSTPRGRIRAEIGAHIASAPDVTFVAPGVGVSAALRLFRGWGMETRVFGNVYPYTELDARLGVVWSGSVVSVLGGVRALYLNDNGALGAANAGDTSDFFFGPYLGLALAL